MVSHASEAQTAAIEAALEKVDGTDEAAVSLMTGLSGGEFDDLGGLPTSHAPASGLGVT
jgi:copper chaperone CopZ